MLDITQNLKNNLVKTASAGFCKPDTRKVEIDIKLVIFDL
jgi:hypothetical protein